MLLAQARRCNAIAKHCCRHKSAVASATSRVNGTADRKRYMPPTANGRFAIEQINDHYAAAVAAIDFKAGDVVGTAPGVFQSNPTRFTIQVREDKHIAFEGGLEYVNHSCSPNSRLVVSENTPEIAFITTRDVKAGESLSFDYSTTEWDMDEKFDCHCGSSNCRGHIGGAKYLSDKNVAESLPLFTPSILRLLLTKKVAN